MEKHSKIHEKFRNMMAEMAEEVVDEEAQKLVEEKMKEMMKHEHIPISTYTLAALLMGMEVSMKALVEGNQHIAFGIMVAMNRIVKERVDKVKKATDDAEGHES